MEENKKLNSDGEVFEGFADLLVTIGAECRKRGAKPPFTTTIKGESEAENLKGGADDDRG
jgi:hypothetical protein